MASLIWNYLKLAIIQIIKIITKYFQINPYPMISVEIIMLSMDSIALSNLSLAKCPEFFEWHSFFYLITWLYQKDMPSMFYLYHLVLGTWHSLNMLPLIHGQAFRITSRHTSYPHPYHVTSDPWSGFPYYIPTHLLPSSLSCHMGMCWAALWTVTNTKLFF